MHRDGVSDDNTLRANAFLFVQLQIHTFDSKDLSHTNPRNERVIKRMTDRREQDRGWQERKLNLTTLMQLYLVCIASSFANLSLWHARVSPTCHPGISYPLKEENAVLMYNQLHK